MVPIISDVLSFFRKPKKASETLTEEQKQKAEIEKQRIIEEAKKKEQEEKIRTEAAINAMEIKQKIRDILDNHEVYSEEASLDAIKAALIEIHMVIKKNAKWLAIIANIKQPVNIADEEKRIKKTADELMNDYTLNKLTPAVEEIIEENRYKHGRFTEVKDMIFSWYRLERFI